MRFAVFRNVRSARAGASCFDPIETEVRFKLKQFVLNEAIQRLWTLDAEDA
jgi:hypothetical protein